MPFDYAQIERAQRLADTGRSTAPLIVEDKSDIAAWLRSGVAGGFTREELDIVATVISWDAHDAKFRYGEDWSYLFSGMSEQEFWEYLRGAFVSYRNLQIRTELEARRWAGR